MRGILLISHGNMAKEIENTLKLFSGKIEQIDSLGLSPGQKIEDFENLLKSKINKLDSGDGVIVFCDLGFGTPCNIVGKILKNQPKECIQVITGMNLPMVLEYLQMRNTSYDINEVIQTGKNGIFDFKARIEKGQS